MFAISCEVQGKRIRGESKGYNELMIEEMDGDDCVDSCLEYI